MQNPQSNRLERTFHQIHQGMHTQYSRELGSNLLGWYVFSLLSNHWMDGAGMVEKDIFQDGWGISPGVSQEHLTLPSGLCFSISLAMLLEGSQCFPKLQTYIVSQSSSYTGQIMLLKWWQPIGVLTASIKPMFTSGPECLFWLFENQTFRHLFQDVLCGLSVILYWGLSLLHTSFWRHI